MNKRILSIFASLLLCLGTGLVFLALTYTETRSLPTTLESVAAQNLTYLDFGNNEIESFDQKRSTSQLVVKLDNQTDLTLDEQALGQLNEQLRVKLGLAAPTMILPEKQQLLSLDVRLIDEEELDKNRQALLIDQGQKRTIVVATKRFRQNWQEKMEIVAENGRRIMGTGQELMTMVLVHELIHFQTDLASFSTSEIEELAQRYDCEWTNQLRPQIFDLSL